MSKVSKKNKKFVATSNRTPKEFIKDKALPIVITERKGNACDQNSCSLFGEWTLTFVPPVKWIALGADGCENCKHFRRFDLYLPKK